MPQPVLDHGRPSGDITWARQLLSTKGEFSERSLYCGQQGAQASPRGATRGSLPRGQGPRLSTGQQGLGKAPGPGVLGPRAGPRWRTRYQEQEGMFFLDCVHHCPARSLSPREGEKPQK